MTEYYPLNEIKQIISEKGTPVRLAVYSDCKLLGYKADSAWTLDEEMFKVHDLNDTQTKKRLMKNLLSAFNNTTEQSWFRRFNLVRVVFEDLSPNNKGKRLLAYEIFKNNKGEYKMREAA